MWDLATAGRSAPFAVVDLDAFDANAADLVRRAAGRPAGEAKGVAKLAKALLPALDNLDLHIETDGNLLTGQNPASSESLARTLLDRLENVPQGSK